MLDRTNYNDKERRYINALSPTEEERKRAETLYAKCKIKWAGYDQRTRLKWLKQMAANAPAWATIFKLVWFLFYTDGALQEAQSIKERIEAEA